MALFQDTKVASGGFFGGGPAKETLTEAEVAEREVRRNRACEIVYSTQRDDGYAEEPRKRPFQGARAISATFYGAGGRSSIVPELKEEESGGGWGFGLFYPEVREDDEDVSYGGPPMLFMEGENKVEGEVSPTVKAKKKAKGKAKASAKGKAKAGGKKKAKSSAAGGITDSAALGSPVVDDEGVKLVEALNVTASPEKETDVLLVENPETVNNVQEDLTLQPAKEENEAEEQKKVEEKPAVVPKKKKIASFHVEESHGAADTREGRKARDARAELEIHVREQSDLLKSLFDESSNPILNPSLKMLPKKARRLASPFYAKAELQPHNKEREEDMRKSHAARPDVALEEFVPPHKTFVFPLIGSGQNGDPLAATVLERRAYRRRKRHHEAQYIWEIEKALAREDAAKAGAGGVNPNVLALVSDAGAMKKAHLRTNVDERWRMKCSAEEGLQTVSTGFHQFSRRGGERPSIAHEISVLGVGSEELAKHLMFEDEHHHVFREKPFLYGYGSNTPPDEVTPGRGSEEEFAKEVSSKLGEIEMSQEKNPSPMFVGEHKMGLFGRSSPKVPVDKESAPTVPEDVAKKGSVSPRGAQIKTEVPKGGAAHTKGSVHSPKAGSVSPRGGAKGAVSPRSGANGAVSPRGGAKASKGAGKEGKHAGKHSGEKGGKHASGKNSGKNSARGGKGGKETAHVPTAEEMVFRPPYGLYSNGLVDVCEIFSAPDNLMRGKPAEVAQNLQDIASRANRVVVARVKNSLRKTCLATACKSVARAAEEKKPEAKKVSVYRVVSENEDAAHQSELETEEEAGWTGTQVDALTWSQNDLGLVQEEETGGLTSMFRSSGKKNKKVRVGGTDRSSVIVLGKRPPVWHTETVVRGALQDGNGQMLHQVLGGGPTLYCKFESPEEFGKAYRWKMDAV